MAVRSPLPPASIAAAVRETLRELDPQVPLYRQSTMSELVSRDVAQPRLYLLLLGGFAATAVALAGLGVYSVIAFGVRQRTVEIGVRLAMGAAGRQVLSLIVAGGVKLAAAGIVCGLVVAFGAGKALSWLLAERFPDTQLLYDTPPTDTLSIVAAATLFGIVAVAASYIPARRAARLQPVVALREE
jgi:putative ABC transport system permease protein